MSLYIHIGFDGIDITVEREEKDEPIVKRPHLCVGDKVLITRGPFAGRLGIIKYPWEWFIGYTIEVEKGGSPTVFPYTELAYVIWPNRLQLVERRK